MWGGGGGGGAMGGIRGHQWSGCSVRSRLQLRLPHSFHHLLSIVAPPAHSVSGYGGGGGLDGECAGAPGVCQCMGVVTVQRECEGTYLPPGDEPVAAGALAEGGDEGEVRKSLVHAPLDGRVGHVLRIRLRVAAGPHDGGRRVGGLAAPEVQQPLINVPFFARNPRVVVVLVHMWPVPANKVWLQACAPPPLRLWDAGVEC